MSFILSLSPEKGKKKNTNSCCCCCLYFSLSPMALYNSVTVSHAPLCESLESILLCLDVRRLEKTVQSPA
jgi:hypothetical protein